MLRSQHEVISSTVYPSHHLCIMYLTEIVPSCNYVIQQVPLFGAWMHPGVFLMFFMPEDGVGNDEVELGPISKHHNICSEEQS